jgi:hypothetical protein
MTATRQHLLDLARQYRAADDAALAVAACVTSEDSVAPNEAQLKWLIGKNEAKYRLSHRVATFGFALFLGLWALLSWLQAPSAAVLIPYGVMVVAFVVAVRTCIAAENRVVDARKHLSKLSPIAGGNRCEEALRYIESGYPDVQAWRDLALAERGQLYGFDVDVMQALYQLEDVKRTSADRQRRNQEACRKLHGIEPVVA